MDACEELARRWAKKEDVEVDTLSEWVKSIADVLKRRMRRLKGKSAYPKLLSKSEWYLAWNNFKIS